MLRDVSSRLNSWRRPDAKRSCKYNAKAIVDSPQEGSSLDVKVGGGLKFLFAKDGSRLAAYTASHPRYSRTPFIWINWDGEPTVYAESPDNWTFL